MKKKITGIVLLLTLIAPVVVTMSWLQLEKLQLKKSIKKQLIHSVDREQLTLLKFTQAQTKTELNWKHSKEFEWENNMYDIVEQEIQGDTVLYWCYFDSEETEINHKISLLLQSNWQNNNNKNKNEKRLLHFFKLLYCQENAHKKPMFFYSEKQNDIQKKVNIIQFKVAPPTPPPRI